MAGEFEELGEFGEMSGEGEFGEFGEMSGEGEFGEFGEMGAEFGEAQEFGEILGEVAGETSSPLGEGEALELASELLEVSSEQELEQFLGNVFKKVARGVGKFIKSPVGKALGGILKSVAKKALPVVGGALGSMVAPGIGTAIGSKLGSLAGGLFELELEGMPQEHAELEVARRYVNLAASAARNAALARPGAAVDPRTLARAAVAQAARAHAPGLYRSMMPSLRPIMRRRASARPGAYYPRRRPYVRQPYYGYGAAGDGDGTAAAAAAADAAAAGAPVSPYGGPALSGRWVRRGGKIIVLGV